MTAESALEAPVIMLHVYCSCPGVSATINFLFVEKTVSYIDCNACSLSASRPSTKRANSSSSPCVPYLGHLKVISADLKNHFAIKRRRPIRVDFPSSTDPHVINLSNDFERSALGSFDFFIVRVITVIFFYSYIFQKYPCCFFISIDKLCSLSTRRPCLSDVLATSVSSSIGVVAFDSMHLSKGSILGF